MVYRLLFTYLRDLNTSLSLSVYEYRILTRADIFKAKAKHIHVVTASFKLHSQQQYLFYLSFTENVPLPACVSKINWHTYISPSFQQATYWHARLKRLTSAWTLEQYNLKTIPKWKKNPTHYWYISRNCLFIAALLIFTNIYFWWVISTISKHDSVSRLVIRNSL